MGFGDSEMDALKRLDAYGHLTYTLGFSDEGNEDVAEDSDRGDWLACFDFCVFTEDGKVKVAYHAVVNSDSGGFIDTVERGVVDADEAPLGLPERYIDSMYEQGVEITEQEDVDAQDCVKRWQKDLKDAIEQERVVNDDTEASDDFERSLLRDAFRDNLRACIDNAIEDGLTADEVDEILRQEI